MHECKRISKPDRSPAAEGFEQGCVWRISAVPATEKTNACTRSEMVPHRVGQQPGKQDAQTMFCICSALRKSSQGIKPRPSVSHQYYSWQGFHSRLWPWWALQSDPESFSIEWLVLRGAILSLLSDKLHCVDEIEILEPNLCNCSTSWLNNPCCFDSWICNCIFHQKLLQIFFHEFAKCPMAVLFLVGSL